MWLGQENFRINTSFQAKYIATVFKEQNFEKAQVLKSILLFITKINLAFDGQTKQRWKDGSLGKGTCHQS